MTSDVVPSGKSNCEPSDVWIEIVMSPHPIGGVNSRLYFWQLFLPSFGILGRDYCSPTNLARRKTACFDLTTNRCQSNSIPTRELIERIGSLHVAVLYRQLKNQALFHAKFQHGTILRFNPPRSSSAHVKARRPHSWWTKVGKFRLNQVGFRLVGLAP
jgi:hypothetical protein